MMNVSDYKFTIGIIDAHPIFRKGLASVLRDELNIKEVFEGDSAAKAIEIADNHKPDLMILDLMIPNGGGVVALSLLARAHPGLPCVVLTMNDSPDSAINTLNEGARGYILKGIPVAEFVAAIRSILEGDTFVSPAFAKRLLTAAQENKARRDPIGTLTMREEQVLHELKSGHSNREIANALSIQEKTVKFYMSSIMHKLGAKNRVEALVAYQRSAPTASTSHANPR
jgi:two-component system, NarL family, nitrate/nitrite response regulator NarL